MDTSPLGTGKNWVTSVGGLPLYIRAIAHALIRNGHDESSAIQLAVGTVKRWAAGGGKVTEATRAKAAAALAEWEAKKGASHALSAEWQPFIDLAGAWTESLHPRVGGKFAPKGTQTQGAQPKPGQGLTVAQVNPAMAAQIKDFQRRNGLPVTGTLTPQTRAAVQHALSPGGGGGGKGKGGAGKAGAASKKAAALAKKQAKATAAAKLKAQRALTTQQAKALRVEKAKATATAAAVNKLTPAQRAQYRAKAPKAPLGYSWTPTGALTTASASAAAQQVAALLAGHP